MTPEELVETVVQELRTYSYSDVERFIAEIGDRICLHCGNEHLQHGRCQCRNDE